ncbi:MAG: hypothetical protein WC842_01810 [Candidatus Paceibacterota bacterium]|jgi:hypothetical protein
MEKIQEVLKDVLRILEAENSEFFFGYFARKRPESKKMTLSMSDEEIEYNSRPISLVITGMLSDFFNIKENEMYPSIFLKNSNRKGVFSLDGIRKFLGIFSLLRCSIINEKIICFYFLDPINYGEIKNIAESCGFSVSNNQEILEVRGGDSQIFIKGHRVYMQISGTWTQKEALKNICMLSTIIVRIHQDHLVESDNNLIRLSFYSRWFDLMDVRAGSLAANLKIVAEEILAGRFPNEILKETRRSSKKSFEDKCFKLEKKYLEEHIQYVVFLPKERAFAVRFSIPIDKHAVESRFTNFEFNCEKTEFRKKGFLKKGGATRFINRKITLKILKIFKNKRELASIIGDRIFKFSLDSLEEAIEIFSSICSKRMLVSGWMQTASHDCDLNEFERYAIKNVDDLIAIYSFFVHHIEEHEWGQQVAKGMAEIDGFDHRKSVPDTVYELLTNGNECTNFFADLSRVLFDLQPKVTRAFDHYLKFEGDTRVCAISLFEKYLTMTSALRVIKK